MLNAWGFALAMVGGLGVLFALVCSPWIRCYNRICVYLAFFSLLALAVLLDRPWRSSGSSATLRGICCLGLMLLCSLGMLDQTTGRGYFGPNYARSCREFASDREHVRQIEAQLPARAMVLQLPYVPFVEHTPQGTMQVHDHLLHGERCVDRALRIVLVGDRSAEHRHDRVAYVLVDGPLVAADLPREEAALFTCTCTR